MLRLAAIFALAASALAAQDLVSARYIQPSDAYGHGAVEGGEFDALEVTFTDGTTSQTRYENAVFEDTNPRLHDFNGDGAYEVVTVVAGFSNGARVQIFGGKDGQVFPIGSNAPIGQRNRWLAIVGVADFDGDGLKDIAYIDRPHLAKTLRILKTTSNGSIKGRPFFSLSPLVSKADLTNHHYGAPYVEGGIRDCEGAAPVIVTASGDWQQIVETRFDGSKLSSKPVADYGGPESFENYLACD